MPQKHCRKLRLLIIACLLATFPAIWLVAQDTASTEMPQCDPKTTAQQLQSLAQSLAQNVTENPQQAYAELFQLGLMVQEQALTCGHIPAESELDQMIAQLLTLTNIETILAASAVGNNIEAILTELENTTGDLFMGQMLYNGLEKSLDGTTLGCSGCHNGQVAPPTEGMWTRITEIRLNEPELEGYSFERYIVESIINPNAFIAPDYVENLMPTNYGNRLDIQQLADLIAFLESQDQFLENGND